MENKEVQGWHPVAGATKWHYFKNETVSLCGKWWLFAGLDTSALEDNNHNSKDNCAACKKMREKL